MDEKLKELVVLYVEDEVIIKKILERSLAHKVKQLYMAGDGREGLELFRRHRPDIVVTDINMPVMNGLEMIRQIRAIDPDVPIIAATAFSEEDYFSEVVDMDVNAFLIKPVNVSDLLEKISEVLAAPGTEAESDQMLVIGPDDEEEYVFPLIYQFLRKKGHLAKNITSRKLLHSEELLEEAFRIVRQLQDDGEILFLNSDHLPVLDTQTTIAPCNRSIEGTEAYLRAQCQSKTSDSPL